MSEYQYYEWQTVDRLLTDAEQAEVNRLSSHIEVGASQVEKLLQGYHQYGEAVAQLAQLRDLADFQKARADFNRRLRELRGRYASRSALIERLNRAGLT
jgi:uncharacterized protein involved in exopolysaccharide biosynthesis